MDFEQSRSRIHWGPVLNEERPGNLLGAKGTLPIIEIQRPVVMGVTRISVENPAVESANEYSNANRRTRYETAGS